MKGFTLTELLIVIVIIGLLAVIAVPRLLELTDSAYRSNIRANANSVKAAVNMYYANSVVVSGTAIWPASIEADMFADNKVPSTSSGDYTWEYDSSTGAVSHNAN